MDDLFRLLEERNSRLKEFYNINALEMRRLSCGKAENLKNFCAARERLLKAIASANQKIVSAAPPSKPNLSPQAKNKIKNLLLLKRAVILSILDQDVAIISLVENLASRSKRPPASRRGAARKSLKKAA